MLASLDELLSLGVGVVDESARRNLEAARTRVAEDRFNLVVLGEFKRGKSTLINALLERDILPVGVVPLTSVVTAIGAGDRDRLVVHYLDGASRNSLSTSSPSSSPRRATQVIASGWSSLESNSIMCCCELGWN